MVSCQSRLLLHLRNEEDWLGDQVAKTPPQRILRGALSPVLQDCLPRKGKQLSLQSEAWVLQANAIRREVVKATRNHLPSPCRVLLS